MLDAAAAINGDVLWRATTITTTAWTPRIYVVLVQDVRVDGSLAAADGPGNPMSTRRTSTFGGKTSARLLRELVAISNVPEPDGWCFNSGCWSLRRPLVLLSMRTPKPRRPSTSLVELSP